jgi:hypothetical protein
MNEILVFEACKASETCELLPVDGGNVFEG